ncbi:hypothetical protein [Stenotrophomonas sp. SMYL89]|uniref:hypothetical protein n=1 Tax=Stenotrophomonas sp. SMYL89 TaxID=3076046 RepID=UPI002E767D7F|nr:hypothetical protein [Stenotrophomonas sp. SMYL89]
MSAPDSSMSSAQPATTLLPDGLAEFCLRICGPGRVVLFGAEMTMLTAPLRRAGCEVSTTQIEADGERPEWMVAWAQTDALRSEALGSDVSTLVLVGGAGADMPAWREQACERGWDLHPAIFTMPGVLGSAALLVLARSGVRSTSADTIPHASFHGLAAALVRPGDAVMATEAAGDGVWRIVQQQSRCRWLGVLASRPPAPSQPGLEWINPARWPEFSDLLDVVITQMAVDAADWHGLLRNAHAPLRRSGRLVLRVPLAHGLDPLSHLVTCLEELELVVDRAWYQRTAGRTGLEQFHEIDRETPLATARGESADAIVLLAVKTGGRGVTQDPSAQVPNIIAFHRDYQDASVVRLIVSMGERIESPVLRRQLARSVLDSSSPTSADHGAALCVLLYDAEAAAGDKREVLLAAVWHYITEPAANPTVLRWQVSLAFAAAQLYQADGRLEEAAELYQRVLAFDVLAFSPLLGTKTTAAAARLGWIRFGQGNVDAARMAWSRGLDEARRLSAQADWSEVVADPAAPETFSMPELAVVMDEAGGLATALRVTAESPLRPGIAWQGGNHTWKAQLQEARTELRLQQEWIGKLQVAKDWLDGQYRHLNAELERREGVERVLESQLLVLAEDMDELRSDLQRHRIESETLQEGKAWLDGHTARLATELRRLMAQHEELSSAKNWLDAQYQSLSLELDQRLTWQRQLQEGKDWLEQQYYRLHEELALRTEELQASQSENEARAAEIVGLRAAFRFAHLHAEAEWAGLQDELQRRREELAQVHNAYQRQSAALDDKIAAHRKLEEAARDLAAATGLIIGNSPQLRFPAEAIAEEMTSLASALQRMPLKSVVRTALRLLTKLLDWRHPR